MSRITLAGSMPPNETNGLAPFADDFIKNPTEARLVIAVISSAKTVESHDKNEVHPVLRIRHWEIVPDKDRKKVADVLGRALADRTGAMELPLEPGDDVPPLSQPFPEEDEDGEDAEVRNIR